MDEDSARKNEAVRTYATSLEVVTVEVATSLTRKRFQVTANRRVESCLANRLEWLDR